MHFSSLSSSAQTAYSDLVDGLLDAPSPHRGLSYVKRTVKKRDYWYVQQVIGEHKRSFYLGPDDERTRGLVLAAKQHRRADLVDRPTREQLVSVGIAAGLWSPNAAETRIYEALSQAGVFAIGGVLVGTHAFLNIGNLLCVRWSRATGRTEDVDVAHDPELKIAAPNITGDIEAELQAHDPNFIAVPSLDARHPSTSFRIRGKRLSVSLLTPERGKPAVGPVRISALKAAATPLRYLDYLIDCSVLAAVPAAAGILIRIPDPARFALHKLVISQRRPPVMTSKVRKDIEQASALLAVLLELRPGDISRAADAAHRQGPKFRKLLKTGAGLLPQALRERLDSKIG